MSDPLFLRFGREFSAGRCSFERESGAKRCTSSSRGWCGSPSVWGARTARSRRSGGASSSARWPSSTASPARRRRVVLEDARCLVIDAATLEQMIANNTEIALRLVKKLARRLDSADEMIQMLLNPDPKARVLLALRRHAEAFGEETATRRAPPRVGVGHRARGGGRRLAGPRRAVASEPAAHRRGRRDGRDPGHGPVAPAGVHGVPRYAPQGSRARAPVELRVIGCHGGETPKHRTSAFVVDDRSRSTPARSRAAWSSRRSARSRPSS